MTSQTLTPDVTSSPASRGTALLTSLREALLVRRTPSAHRPASNRAARRAEARTIAAYPATRSASGLVLPTAQGGPRR
jgi:hypothetical protein